MSSALLCSVDSISPHELSKGCQWNALQWPCPILEDSENQKSSEIPPQLFSLFFFHIFHVWHWARTMPRTSAGFHCQGCKPWDLSSSQSQMILKEFLEVEAVYDFTKTQYFLSVHSCVSEVALLVSNADYGHCSCFGKEEKIRSLPSYVFTVTRIDKKDLVCLGTEYILFVPELYLL